MRGDMSKFLRIKNQIINIDEILNIEVSEMPKDYEAKVSKHFKLTVFFKNTAGVTWNFETREQAEKMLNLFAEKLEAVRA